MTEGKLSEQLAQLGAIDEDGRHAHLCHKARELEAEVEQWKQETIQNRVAVLNAKGAAREFDALYEKHKALEGEVERLRDADDCVTRMGDACDRHCKELDVYRAAVAELRKALINDDCGDIGVSTRAVMLTFLNKLPQG